MRHYKWLYLLLITTMLLSSCQANELAATDVEAPSPLLAKVNPLTVSISDQQVQVANELEPNECLNCHTDKERLIETATVEEAGESESSGVG